MSKLLALLMAMLLATSAHAVCYKDGKGYPTGTVVGGYECLADGTWKKK